MLSDTQIQLTELKGMRRWFISRLKMKHLIILILLTVLSWHAAGETVNVEISNGVLDLSKVDLKNDLVKASGEWLFYKEVFFSDAMANYEGVINVTNGKKNGWNLQTDYGAKGFGTYGLKIIFPPEMPPGNILSFMMYRPKTSANLLIDGVHYASSGIPNENYSDTVPSQKTILTNYKVENQTAELLIQVSNNIYHRAGIDHYLFVGSQENIGFLKGRTLTLQAFSAGALALLSLYHLVLFLYRRKSRELLVLAVFSMVISVRMFFLEEKPYLFLLGEISASIALNMELFTVFFAMPILYVYYYYIFPNQFSNKVKQFVVWTAAGVVLLSVFIETYTYSQIIGIFELYILTTYVLVITGLIKAIKQKEKYAPIFICGFLIIIAGSLNDILYERGIIGGGFIIQYAILLFTVCQAMLLGKRFSDSQSRVENINIELEEKVRVRTNELKKIMQQNRVLLKETNEIAENERKNIAQAIHDGINASFVALKMQGDRIISMINNNEIDKQLLKVTADLIVNIALESYDNARKLTLSLRPEVIDVLGLEAAIESLLKIYDRDKLKINTHFDVRVKELPEEVSISVYRIIQEAITNVVKHSSASLCDISFNMEDDVLTISIKDNGKGLSNDSDLHKGIGLIGIRERAYSVGGKVEFNNKDGFEVLVTIPVHNN